MPDRCRRERGPLVVVGMALFAIVLTAFITNDPADQPVEQPSASAEEYPKEQQGPAEGRWLPEFSARDTYAQWGMAVLTLAATAVSIWAVRLVRDQLIETRKALCLSAEANKISRGIGQAQIRAYLSVRLTDIRFFPKCRKEAKEFRLHGRVDVTVVATLQNFGNTPARNVRASCSIIPIAIPSGDDPFDVDIPLTTEESQSLGYVAPQEATVVSFTQVVTCNHEELAAGQTQIAVVGVIRYETAGATGAHTTFSSVTGNMSPYLAALKDHASPALIVTRTRDGNEMH